MSGVGCQFCHRVKLPSGDWGYDPSVFASVIGICVTCLARLYAAQRREYERRAREVARRLATGTLKTPSLDDPFEPFVDKPRAD